jgi:hypothetical protein
MQAVGTVPGCTLAARPRGADCPVACRRMPMNKDDEFFFRR